MDFIRNVDQLTHVLWEPTHFVNQLFITTMFNGCQTGFINVTVTVGLQIKKIALNTVDNILFHCSHSYDHVNVGSEWFGRKL